MTAKTYRRDVITRSFDKVSLFTITFFSNSTPDDKGQLLLDSRLLTNHKFYISVSTRESSRNIKRLIAKSSPVRIKSPNVIYNSVKYLQQLPEGEMIPKFTERANCVPFI